ncbi:MAG: hypothetical protein LLG04_14580 [Parachlamydia sp.]|nr:hypothetical protein [Parachlamydia sp.]
MFLNNILNSNLSSTFHRIGIIAGTNAGWQTLVPVVVGAAVILAGIQCCSSKPTLKSRDIKKQPDPLEHLKKSLPTIAKASALMAFLSRLASKESGRRKLLERIAPSKTVDNLLVLEEMLRPYGADSTAALACKDLDRLLANALEEQLKRLPQAGQELLEQTQTLVGKAFPLPLSGKLALVASLYEPKFQTAYKATLGDYQKCQNQMLKDHPLDDAATKSWKTQITPLLEVQYAPRKYQSVRLLENLLMAKAGMGEPLPFAENLPAIALSQDQLRDNNRWCRPIHSRESALKNLQRYTPEEQKMLQREGYSPNVQLGCLDFFNLQCSDPFDQNGVRKFSKCQFTVGYAHPSLGTVTGQLGFTLTGFEDQDPVVLMRFMKECMDTDLKGIDKVIQQNQALLDKLGESRKSQLIDNSHRLKQESDRLLKMAYMALGNSTIALPKELTFTQA